MSWGDNLDYSHLATWWLVGPIALVVSFILGVIGWKLYCMYISKKQERKLQELKENWEGSLENSSLLTKSSALSTPKKLTIDIKFENLGLRLRTTGKKVLQGVTGEIRSSRMTAVMGPSGSGKTTFMTTIAGKAYYGKMNGKILINERSDLPITKFKNVTGFVPQEDVMLREMTVEETLRFAAKTRLPKSMSNDEKNRIIEDTLEILDLKSIRYSPIGDEDVRGISGGQRKRVNIGIELVSDPTLLFLDEPTSGLDSSSSLSICSALRKISSLGLTIVSVIHQPRYEIFEMFHDVLLLAKGGRTVYLGPTKDALSYFESLGFECPNHVNPADFLIDVISEQQPDKDGNIIKDDELVRLWRIHQSKVQEEIPDDNVPPEEPFDYSDTNSTLGYDTGVNPVNLNDFVRFIKKVYRYSKGTIEKQIPALTLTKEELFPVNVSEGDFDTENDSKVNRGSILTGIGMFIFVMLTFLTAPIAVFKLPFEKSQPSLYRQYGGILAVCFDSLVMFLIFFLRFISIVFSGNSVEGVGYLGVVVFCFIPGVSLFFCTILIVKRFKEGEVIPYAKELFGGMFGWLFYIGITWNAQTTSIPKRMAGLIGFLIGGYWILCLTSTILIYPGSDDPATFPFWPEPTGIAIFYGFVTFLLARRMHILPLQIRALPSFKQQLFQITKRSFIQITRSWIIYIFDILLVINAGLFVGIIYYQQYYEPPIIESYPNAECPEGSPDEVCRLLTIPQKDPLSGQASITCLSIALAAVASSLRIFGDERVTFRRESTSGLSTEAYYIGKSIAHLPTEIIAPLAFTLFYYSLILPISPFYQYFFLYFLIYWSCAGLAFLISLVTPPSLSQLAGVLTVLSFMMFSGAAPTLNQLKYNELLPYILWAISWLSLFRYTQELYYLIGILPYNPSPDTATLQYYGYNLNDSVLCYLMIFGLGLTFRFFAYIALVIRERKR